MKKKEKMIIIIVAVLVLVLAAALFVISNYRGEDGLTYSERKHLEKNGEAVVDWDAMEEAQQEDGFFARLFNGGDDGSGDNATSAASDKKDKNDSSSSKSDSSDDAKKPASGSDTDSADGKDDSSKSDQDSGSSSDQDDSGKDQDSGDSGEDSSPAKPAGGSEYEKYMAMSPEEQEAFFETFDSPEAFIKWFNNAKAKYEAGNDSIVVEGGGIDIGDYQ